MRYKDRLLWVGAMLVLGLPFFVLIAGGSKQFGQRAEPTPTASWELKDACQVPSPDGRFCAGALDFAGVMVQAEDGRFLHVSLWKWNNFIDWVGNGRYALFENHDQYGNQFGLILDTERWEVWRPDQENTCTLGMSAQCQLGFVLVTPDWLLQGNGNYVDLVSHSEKFIFAEEGAGFIWLATLSPDKTKIAFLGAEKMATDGPGGTSVALYIANADGSNLTRVPNYSFSVRDVYPPQLNWQADSQHLYFTVEHKIYTYNIIIGDWAMKPEGS